MIRVGIVGFGTATTIFHISLLQSSHQFDITHVLERKASKSAQVLPNAAIVRSMEELLETDVQVIVIATPTNVHHMQAKQALLAKKHVVVDKPLCVTYDEAQELINIAKQMQVVFTVFHNRRWDSDFLTIKELIQSQKLGELHHVEIHFDRYRPVLKQYWKETAIPGAGMIYDLGSHLVDQALQLFGQPNYVKSDVQIQRKGAQNDDYFRLELSYSDKPVKVILTAGMLVKELGPKYILEGSAGRFEKYGEDIQESMLREGKRPSDQTWGVEPISSWGSLTLNKTSTIEKIESKIGAYETFYDNLWKVLSQGEQILVTPESAAEVIKIVEDAKKDFLSKQ